MTEGVQISGRVNWPNLVTVLSAAILIGTEVVGIGLATGWALAGMLGLGEYGQYFFEALFALAALALVIAFVRAAARIEPLIER